MTAPGNAAAALGKIEAALARECGKVTMRDGCKLVSATAQGLPWQSGATCS